VKRQKVAVVGAGIGGLTAGALLAKRGYEVTIYEQAIAAGGCASTFRRRGFTFDVGATQVAGLEEGGIHHRIFQELGVPLPAATPCDPACVVYLPDESEPIRVWRDLSRWQQERQHQFPNSEPFWQLLRQLFQASWRFQGRDPVLPPRNLWDLGQLLSAVRLDTLMTVPFTLMTVGDALKLFGLYDDRRLKTFLNLQLKLYSQVDADETALLYGAIALAVSQMPQGLYHLTGSMQVLSDRLIEGLEKYGGKLYLRHRVEAIPTVKERAQGVWVRNLKTGETRLDDCDHLVTNITVQDLLKLTKLDDTNSKNRAQLYQRRIDRLPDPSGAFVVYLGVKRSAIPHDCPPHLQFLYDYGGEIGDNNSLFVSVSKPGDGRAPEGQATIIASSFVDTAPWWQGSREDYQQLKDRYTHTALARLGNYFDLEGDHILHCEAATPRTFAHFTHRDHGIVGGIGQRVSSFGPFGVATRTPWSNLWLVGDSTHPGEGTAGVSYSALTAVRQIEARSGKLGLE
jgi:C-3',4' desaturase CrtD